MNPTVTHISILDRIEGTAVAIVNCERGFDIVMVRDRYDWFAVRAIRDGLVSPLPPCFKPAVGVTRAAEDAYMEMTR